MVQEHYEVLSLQMLTSHTQKGCCPQGPVEEFIWMLCGYYSVRNALQRKTRLSQINSFINYSDNSPYFKLGKMNCFLKTDSVILPDSFNTQKWRLYFLTYFFVRPTCWYAGISICWGGCKSLHCFQSLLRSSGLKWYASFMD